MALPPQKKIKISHYQTAVEKPKAVGDRDPKLSFGEDVNMQRDGNRHGGRTSPSIFSQNLTAAGSHTSVPDDASLLLLKTHELLNKIELDEKRMAKIDDRLRELKILIERTPSRQSLPVCSNQRYASSKCSI